MNRVLYFDVLNVLSCISVVCMHANGYVHSFVKDEWWWLRVLIEVVCYFAVPVFFMLSGATLLKYRERYTTITFLHKRFLKTFVPFVLWGTFFYGLHAINKSDISLDWREVLENFTIGKIPYTVYWFFIPLFLLYLFIPFLSVMVSGMSKKSLLGLILLLFVLQIVLPTLYLLLGVNYDMSLPIGGYVIYALLGYYIVQYNPERDNKVLAFVGIFAVLAMMVRYFSLFNSDVKVPILFTYFGLYAIFPAVFVFLVVKKMSPPSSSQPQGAGAIWTLLAKRSFGVYLIHFFFIVLFSKVFSRQNPLFIPVATICVYIISVLIIMLLQKTRITKFLVP